MVRRLGITARCVESIASKTSIDPSSVDWSYTYNRKLDAINNVPEVGSVPKDWWIEDLCELDIDVYKRVMSAVILKKRVDGDVLGEALKTYCLRWWPDCNDRFESDEHVEKYKLLIESMSCMLRSTNRLLLKVSVLVRVDQSLRHLLVRDISLKLDEASVRSRRVYAIQSDLGCL
ncbi:hypothetical protein L1987_13251 [Smallanthus sonchifolius]|uniref:Uncharacterized protein n=1 Tax=Smallanthus sonchifolius TaxID=185202 RepID=A0ACB9JJI1_9ASTR|nr:hypothetical protein L1987_13251 [Smallanthus sonchifolius]